MSSFTVIITTKARPEMLERAVRSALAQKGAALDVLIADDGAGEGLAVAARFGISALSSGGAGQVPARNLAVAAARTEWIAWLDDDDWWTDGAHLARAAAALQTGSDYWFAGGAFIEDGKPPVAFAPHVDNRTLERDNGILVSALCYRRDLHGSLGSFDETLPVYWDWDWSLRVARSGARLVQDMRQSVAITRHGGNVTAPGQEEVRRQDLQRLALKHGLGGLELKTHIDLVT